MTVVSTIITDAYREANLIAVGASETTPQQTEGLRLLNRFIKSLFGLEFGEPLIGMNFGSNNVDTESIDRSEEFYMARDYFVPLNRRVVLNLEEATTLNLHPKPQDGSRIAISDASGNLATYNLILSGNGRTIEDATTLTLSEDSLDREWFYRADQSNWVRLTDLVIADNSPFPEEFDDLLIIGLAMRLASRYGVATVAETANTYSRIVKTFKSRYKQSSQKTVDEALLRLKDFYTSVWNVRGAFERGFD